MKTVILIGSSGFLGSHVLAELLEKNYQVLAARHKSPLPYHANLKVLTGGIRGINKALIDQCKPEFIIHTARPTMPSLKKLGRRIAGFKAYSLNKYLLKQMELSSSRPKIIFASGSLAYGSSTSVHDENSKLNPISFSRQYIRGEQPFIKATKNNSHPVCLVRMPWLTGNGSWFKWFYLENIKKYKAIPLFGEGKNIMEVIDVKDAARLMIRIGEYNQNIPVVNLSSPYRYTQKEFATLTSEVFRCSIKNYQLIYPHKPEKEILEAFYSNILLKTNYPEIFEGFTYTDPIQRIRQITGEYSGV